MTAIAKEKKVTIVAEGVPLYSNGFSYSTDGDYSFSNNEAKDSVTQDEVGLAKFVAKRSRFYDYDVSRMNSIFQLRKRYSNSSDLPDVSLEECSTFIQHAISLLQQLNPNPLTTSTVDSASKNFIDTLDASKLTKLRNLRLTFSDLSDSQKEQAKRIALYFHDEVQR